MQDNQRQRPATSVKSYSEKSSLIHGGKDLDHHGLLHHCPGFERAKSATMGGIEDMPPCIVTLLPPKIGCNTISERDFSRLPSSQSGSLRESDHNERLARSGLPHGCNHSQEASASFNHNSGCDEQHARDLIFAYGGKNASKRKVHWLDSVDITSDMAGKYPKSSKDVLVWEKMSPSFGNPCKRYSSALPGCNTFRTRPDATYLGKNFASDWHDQLLDDSDNVTAMVLFLYL